MDASYSEFVATLQDDFDGFYMSDVDKPKSIFHPACHFYSGANSALAGEKWMRSTAAAASSAAP